MRGYNRVIIAGNLARDPEVRYTINKNAYARFSVAINSQRRDANGTYQEHVEYVNVVVWGQTAENCGKYLKKGRPVLVEGSIRTTSYDAKDGSGKRYSTEINADNVIFLGSREGGDNSGGYSQKSSADTSPYGIPRPSDEDFGQSIGDRGFGGGSSFLQDFANDTNNMDGSSIPF